MYKLIKASIDSREKAKSIIDKILSKGLSPCIQLIDNIHSFYRWKDKMEDNVEFLILITGKTSIAERSNPITQV